MKITHNKVGQNLNLKDTATAGAAKSSDVQKNSAIKADGNSAANALSKIDAKDPDASKVTLSNRAQEMNQAKAIAMATPDIDEAKVARLQKLIDAGEYHMDAQKIADKMVDEHSNWAE